MMPARGRSGIYVQVIGHKRLSKQITTTAQVVKKETARRLMPAAYIMIRSIQKQMGGSRTRAIRAGRRPTARVGRLGIDTGYLRRSIGARSRGGIYKKGRTVRGNAYIEFGTSVIYGMVHEKGLTIPLSRGRRGSLRMPRRPFFEPGIRKALPAVRRLVDVVLRVRV